jgi:hypothetical protein
MKNDEKKNNNINNNLTYTQSLCRIINRKNEMFDNNGFLNLDFLNSLDDANKDNRNKKCYDTKSFNEFGKELEKKIKDLNK